MAEHPTGALVGLLRKALVFRTKERVRRPGGWPISA